jgi:hypothetical protein
MPGSAAVEKETEKPVLVGVKKKKTLTSQAMSKYLHCKGPKFSPATHEAWEAYLKAAESDEDATCILCHSVLTPGETTWIDDLQSSGRALDPDRRHICSCIRRCHLKCLLDKSAHVWGPYDESIAKAYKDGVTSISPDFHLKCTREPPGLGVSPSPPAAVLQVVCPAGHSGAVILPLLHYTYSFGTSIDETEAVFVETAGKE